MMRIPHIVLLSALITLLLFGCREQEPPAPTVTIPPTDMATALPATATASPTATVQPTLAPLAVSLTKAEGAMRHDQPLFFRFTQPMDTTFEEPVSTRPRVPTTWEWSEDGMTLTVTPLETGWPTAGRMTVQLEQGQESANGESLGRMRWTVALATRPTVSSFKPLGRPSISRENPVRVYFNAVMDQATVEADLTVSLDDDAYTLSWEDDGATLVITPKIDLLPDTEVVVVIPETVLSQEGLLIKAARSHTWTTPSLIRSIDRPTQAEPQTPIVINFDYAVDATSAENALTVTQDDQPVAGTTTYNSAARKLTFTPDDYWQPDTRYVLRFTEMQSPDGETYTAPEERTFISVPAIVGAIPSSQSWSGVDPNLTVRVTFDRPITLDSAIAAFSISPAVSGTITLENDDTTLVFTPSEKYLTGYTNYSVVIEDVIRSADGDQLLTAPYNFGFRTARRSSNITFGYGARIQTVDSNGRRAVQFGIRDSQPAQIDFALYALPMSVLIDKESALFNVEEVQPKLFDVATLSLVQTWNGADAIAVAEGNRAGDVGEVILPADVSAGFYVLEMSLDGIVEDMLVVQLSAFGLLAKQADEQITVWAADANGNAAPNVAVQVYGSDDTILQTGQTDANGLYQTSLAEQPVTVVAMRDDSAILTGINREWQSEGSYWGWNQPEAVTKMAAAVWTDRPIYRPNQTVNFKAVVRADDDAILSVPVQGTAVTAEIRDPRNNVVQTMALVTNQFGAVSAEFDIADGAMLGDYAVVIRTLGNDVRQSFKVQDYRKPDYQVDVTTDTPRLIVGQPLSITVDSSYFLGEPVRDAETTIVAMRGTRRWDWNYSLQTYYQYDFWFERAKSTRTTDENGQITLQFDTARWSTGGENWDNRVRHAPYLIQADVNDGSNQNVAGAMRIELYEAGEVLDFNVGGYFFAPDETITVAGTVLDIFDEPVANRTVTLRITRYAYDLYSYRTEQQWTVTTDANGEFSSDFTVEDGLGSYRIEGELRDAYGNEVGYRRWLYIHSGDASPWWGSNQQDFTMRTERESYDANETAQLVVESSFEGFGLLTVERGTVRRERLVWLSSPITLIELPLAATDAPNIFVSVAAWEANGMPTSTNAPIFNVNDAEMRIATVELAVTPVNKQLNVSIETDQQTYAPRDEMVATIQVTDENGIGVPAELSLAVVDEAIFTLSEDLSRPLFEAFYYERDHRVRNYDSYEPYRYLEGFGGKGGGGGDGGGLSPRSDFPDTALWLPNLVTDANGFVTVPLTLPDSLTQFRLTARATTLNTQVGEATALITTTQAMRVRPILPRTVTAGDDFELSTLVQNVSGLTTTLTISATWDGLLGEPVEPITITLGVDEQQIVGWGVTAQADGEAMLTVSASAAGVVVDAVEMPLTIAPLAVLDVKSWVGTLQDEPITVDVTKSAETLPISTIEIDLSRSIAGSLLEGLDYLTGYPYGCVEQTMSRALPNAVVSRAFAQLGVASTDPELDGKINASLQKLYGFQHNDGGWGWWFDDPSNHYQSAWVLFGLALIQQADYEVSTQVIENGVVYLQNELPNMDVRTRAYALYSLSLVDGADDDAMHELLDGQLDLFSQTALTLAFANSGDVEQARVMLADIMEEATVSDSGYVYWETGVDDGYYRQKTMASDIRTTALILSAMSQLDPDNELVFGTVEYLMANRKRNGWGTTNETSYAILGLSDHLIAAQSDEANSTKYSVEVDGEVVAEGELGRGNAREVVVISAENITDESTITLRQSGDRPLYYIINQRNYLARETIEATGTISITRSYRLMDDDASTLTNEYNEGDLVRVTLTLQSDDPFHYLLIEDVLPGGLEPLNDALDTTLAVSEYGSRERSTRRNYSHKEVHADRVTFFITEWEAGERLTLTYLARATRTGEFVALPTIAEAMYNPAQWGRSGSDAIVVSD